jgi:hypothetical protein
VQIMNWLRRGRLQLALLVLVPALAMAAAYPLAAESAPVYRVAATVVITPPAGASGGVALSQAVDGFESALLSDAVVTEAAEKTGVAPGEVRDSVDSRRLGASNVVEVVYEGAERAEVGALLRAQTQSAMSLLFQGDLTAAEEQRKSALTGLKNANAAMAKVVKETGVVSPNDAYRAKVGEIGQLGVALAQARSRGDWTDPLRAAQEKAQADLAKLGAVLPKFSQPEFQLTRAQQTLADAEERVAQTSSRLQASQDPTAIRVGESTIESGSVQTLRTVIAAGVIGLLVAIALIALLQFLRPGRENRMDNEPAAAAEPVTAQPRDARQLSGDRR